MRCFSSMLASSQSALIIFCGLILVPVSVHAEGFSDIPSDDPLHTAVTELKNRNIISGYDDGSFRPNNKVNRAEALKIVVAPLVSTEDLQAFTDAPFSDVTDSDWYMPYVEYARTQLKIIDGPPQKTAFHGGNAVKKVELIKMLLLANKINPDAYSEVRMPLSDDVTNPDEWYYPYFRYAFSASMLEIDNEGLLSPGKELTRGDTAKILFYFLMYKENRRTQALLSEADVELARIITAIGENNVEQAEYAAGRGLLAARGAHTSRPDSDVTRSALKITQAYVALVKAYKAGVNLQLEDVVQIAGEAYALADEAVGINTDMSQIADRVKKDAKSLADDARNLMNP